MAEPVVSEFIIATKLFNTSTDARENVPSSERAIFCNRIRNVKICIILSYRLASYLMFEIF